MSAEANLLESEEQTLEAAKALVRDGAAESCAEAFPDLTRHYGRLLRHLRHLIRVGDLMQEELNNLNDRLQRSETKYRSLFENVSEGIFIAQLDGRFLDVNPALARIVGHRTPAEFLQAHQEDFWWPFVDEEEHERLFGALAAHGNVAHLQLRLRRWNGEAIWVEISAHASPDPRHTIATVEGVLSDITERKRILEELRHLATVDGLTGLYNRRHFMELCERELLRARRYRLEAALLMMDADLFKAVNDTHGHDVGDEVLQVIARLCQRQMRDADIIGRLGGEEFAVLLPQTGLEAALGTAERLRQAIAQTTLPLTTGRMLRFTVSIGVSAGAAQTVSLQDLLKRADRALYVAKDRGRNQVVSELDLALTRESPPGV
ncbi:MAG: sensor domain-containing diguanylate cyclase [Candidatus Contendobacter sp.]|nr:GGDEF domain-containing protein [Gammaproteobacteria bacterium]MCC8993281.1 sensor domain-containing diguanylate cyclase [Candidatus Contendobacter sp.]